MWPWGLSMTNINFIHLVRDLSNNKIDTIADDAFEGLDNLEDV